MEGSLAPGLKASLLRSRSHCTLLTLPSVVRCKILSFLKWKDKIIATKAIPKWEIDLQTAFSWKWVKIASRRYRKEKALQNCIQTYGKFFQNCTIDLCVFDVQEDSHGVNLINQIAQQCPNLKSMKIYHMFMVCAFQGKLKDHLVPLKNLFSSCKYLKYVQLCSLDDCPKSKDTENCEFFEVIEELDLGKNVETIEFSLTDNCPRPVGSLVSFRNLCVLKTQISNVNTVIIQSLVKCSLRHLYLHKDHGYTKWGNGGNSQILWLEINANETLFSVYYIFEDVRVEISDFTLNPYLKSITFCRIRHTLSSEILRSIAALYATSLTCFAHLSMKHATLPPYQEMESLPCEYYYFASQCVNLHTFVVGIPSPCEAIWCLAMKGVKLHNLYVKREQLLYNYIVCLPVPSTSKDGDLNCEATFCREVSRWMKHSWKPLNEDEMCEKTVQLLHL